MPRIHSLDPALRRLERISDFIRREMKKQHLHQADMAAVLFISQQAFSVKMSKCSFTAEDLIRIFDRLHVSAERTGELIRE